MKVLVGNFHNSSVGGGEFYTYQVAKAVSEFAEILFVTEPKKVMWANNPSQRLSSYRIWDSKETVDTYINLNHFHTLVCNTAKQNILAVFFPNKSHKVADYNKIVGLCKFVCDNIREVWGVDSLICSPYSKPYKPGKKTPRTILAVGNFFKEADGHSKNQHVLIEAFKELKGTGWKLSLLGGAVNKAYVEELKEAAQGFNIEVVPNASEELKDSLLSSCEFFWHANGMVVQTLIKLSILGQLPKKL